MWENTEISRNSVGLKTFKYENGSFWLKIKEVRIGQLRYSITDSNFDHSKINCNGKTKKTLLNRCIEIIN